jgi:hypothetical protein
VIDKTTVHVRTCGEGRTVMAAATVRPRSSDFASVFLAVTRRPMTTHEIVSETAVRAEVVAEVLRIFALTGSVARSGDRFTARQVDARENGRRLLVG